MVLQRELVYGMLGYTGRIVVDRDGSLALAPALPLIDASERALIQRLLALGSSYRDLDRFVSQQLLAEAGAEHQLRGAYVTAFAFGLDECLQPYRARVLELEQHLLRTPDLSLPALQLGFGDFELTLPALCRLLETIQRNHLSGVKLLDFLHDEIAGCAHSLRAAMATLVQHAQRVQRSQLAAWLLHGELLPGDGDFFIERCTDTAATKIVDSDSGGRAEQAAQDEDDVGWDAFQVVVARKPAAFPMRVAERVLFVGKAVRVLRASERRRADDDRSARIASDSKPAYLDADEIAPTSPTSLVSARFGSPSCHALQNQSPRTSTDADKSSGGVARARAALATAEAALEAAELQQEQAAVAEVEAEAEGLALLDALTRRAVRGEPWGAAQGTEADTPKRPGARAVGRDSDGAAGGRRLSSFHRLPAERAAATQMRVSLEAVSEELRALPSSDGYLQLEPFERLLSHLHRVASALLWQHLTVERGLLELLQTMKDYFLLARGNVFHTLLEDLRPAMAERPPAHLDLQATLLHAMSGEPPGAHTQRLQLVLHPAPPSATVYDCWRQLSLTIAVPWPLQLLLHATSAARYEELFRFLLLVKRVQLELQAAWSSQADLGRLRSDERALLMPLWRLRAHMAFLIDHLQYYLQVDVLEAQWQAFMRVAETCGDFEELSGAHEACLASLHAQCFLQASSVATALHEIFQLCLSLCRMLSYADHGVRAQATYRSQFATISREFSRQSAFLFAFLSNMSSPQTSPHLSQLLLRLNFNSFWRAG